MVEIGKFAKLKVVKDLNFGLYLDADGTEILLPRKYVPKNAEVGSELEVFVYKDSENRPIATTQLPAITLDSFASLKVADLNKYGAFLEWGVDNQLLLPFREQPEMIEIGKRYVVRMYLDRVSGRLVATTRVEKFLEKQSDGTLKENDPADLLVYGITDLGYKVIVNQKFAGIIYKNDVFQKIETGDALQGFIKTIREDGKIDVTLRGTGLGELIETKEEILKALAENNGFLPLSDSSKPEEISRILGISKKSFKRSVGMLYKERKIEIMEKGIRLLK